MIVFSVVINVARLIIYNHLGGFDAPVHISEEATNASTAVPWAIVTATMSGSVLGWGKSLRDRDRMFLMIHTSSR